MDYTGLNLNEIQLMELDEYLFYMREAYIYSLNQTENPRNERIRHGRSTNNTGNHSRP